MYVPPQHNPTASATPSGPTRVLLITDVRSSYQSYLHMLNVLPSMLGLHYLVVAVVLTDAALLTDDEPFDLAILDLGAEAGIALLGSLRARRPELCLIVLADERTTMEQRRRSSSVGALLIDRPVAAAPLRAAISQLLRGAVAEHLR